MIKVWTFSGPGRDSELLLRTIMDASAEPNSRQVMRLVSMPWEVTPEAMLAGLKSMVMRRGGRVWSCLGSRFSRPIAAYQYFSTWARVTSAAFLMFSSLESL